MLESKDCLIIAGEKSGEEHVMSFLPSILENSPQIRFFGVGGDSMKESGVELLYHVNDFSSWGFSEVFAKIPFYFKALNQIELECEKRGAKWAILVDFQDFNLRLAKKLKARGVNVLYYVAPQAWAWKSWRASALEKCVHTLFTIIPFEKKWFYDRGVHKVMGVPHPLYFHYKDIIKENDKMMREINFPKQRKEKILLLPGSRNFEVKSLLDQYVNAVKKRDCEVALVMSSSVKKELYEPYLDYIDHLYQHDELPQACLWADCALAASGTVTLTCALFALPTIVCYRTSLLNEFIFYNFLSYDGPISLANIVHNSEVFPELLQNQVSAYNINYRLDKFLKDESTFLELKETLLKTLDMISGDDLNAGLYMSRLFNDSEDLIE